MMEAGASPASFRAPAKSLQAVYGWLIARGGNIEVMVEEGRSMIEVKIIDSGIGTPDASMSRIFDRFYRAAPLDIEGTGLGLAIAKKIAERNSYVLSVSNRTDVRGVLAQVLIPLNDCA
jgi:two-component system OmpR family sensor kinase